MASKYLKWPRIHVDPDWRFQWFYHQNQTPDLTKFSAGPAIYVWEWFIASPVEGGFQTDELLVKIASLRENQVTAASVVRNWKQRAVQSLQRRKSFGFQYDGSQDESGLSAETPGSATTLRVVQKIFPDQLSVPYVPNVFRASNPPSQVDVEVFKSDPPIPGSDGIKNQKDFHKPVKSVHADAMVEEVVDFSPSSDSDEASPKRSYGFLELTMLVE
ncbi:hypothetical protein PVAP13_8KG147001 [Panicum virgatum]|uniref:Uncharacterized protein n=1 Tax=Panicum virgatum TaxID=38727 RepID=A0A8T0PLS4_PANVG|nr:hypothetical protein PVAP13_8KG147001 [Panicum virgatum]